DFGRRRSIEREIDRRRSIEGEKGKKKKKRKRRKKKRRRRKKKRIHTSFPCAVLARAYHPVPCTVPYRDNLDTPVRTGMSNLSDESVVMRT
ncbi:hypothetical protein BHM03_00026828, partial [Ensete ventricosum]